MLSQWMKNLQIKQIYWDAKRCQKLKFTTRGAPIWLNKSGKGSNFTHLSTLAQLPSHCEMDSLYLWCISHWEKPTKLPSPSVSHGVFYGGDSAAFENSQSPQWEETALKWWEESLGAVAEENTHTHTPEYSLQLQRRNSRPKIIQYCLSCSDTIGCFSKMQQQNQNKHHQ